MEFLIIIGLVTILLFKSDCLTDFISLFESLSLNKECMLFTFEDLAEFCELFEYWILVALVLSESLSILGLNIMLIESLQFSSVTQALYAFSLKSFANNFFGELEERLFINELPSYPLEDLFLDKMHILLFILNIKGSW